MGALQHYLRLIALSIVVPLSGAASASPWKTFSRPPHHGENLSARRGSAAAPCRRRRRNSKPPGSHRNSAGIGELLDWIGGREGTSHMTHEATTTGSSPRSERHDPQQNGTERNRTAQAGARTPLGLGYGCRCSGPRNGIPICLSLSLKGTCGRGSDIKG